MMDFEAYLAYFSEIVDGDGGKPPYDNPEYFAYTKLNWSRTQRWLKKGELHAEVIAALQALQTPQEWIVITEPWCGDAAHIVPFIFLMGEQNPKIRLNLVLRDQPPYLIEQYLSNGSKSIPKLILRDASSGEDLGVWGPRPQGAQRLFDMAKAEGKDFDYVKEALQRWYNEDKGSAIQQEIVDLLQSTNKG